MTFWLFRHRQTDTAARPVSESEVVKAGTDLQRKEQLVERFEFLPQEMKKAAKDTALSRFLDILLSHMRL